ncbi:quinol-cytochrome oxidoreductase complex cytochrome b subunit [Streptomyces olivoverticillatus]|uniref:Quinol-cytochrome oxidoreductase complex cytochrome b subunit n=1 Tax=Streptomyces olivoverticillatus TaxID=66427 RepID=A0A7W7LM88_9ACTN|nr:hypothetical protein [Streptomyces olivoverticillatus]MBB4892226.1 quinol-cytochrome oxidoreductase complex cytochrome b subunit [Streptomyces olivoverticillatus]
MDTATINPTAATETMTAETAEQDVPPAGGTTAIKPLPVWFFCFEGLMSATYDLFKASPQTLWVLGALGVVNIVISLTVLRPRLKLAKRLWRGKNTRKVAIALLALRLGSHLALNLAGLAVVSTAGHIAFAVGMCALTVAMLWFCQRTALRAIAADDAAAGV